MTPPRTQPATAPETTVSGAVRVSALTDLLHRRPVLAGIGIGAQLVAAATA
jgi:hypothetical protein